MKEENEIEESSLKASASPQVEEHTSPWHVIERWDRDERSVVNVICPQCGERFPLNDYAIVMDGMICHIYDKEARDTIPETATLKHSCGFDHLARLAGFEGI